VKECALERGLAKKMIQFCFVRGIDILLLTGVFGGFVFC
jgi:hypothetical protein